MLPKFDLATYTDPDGNPHKEISWKEKPFVKDGTFCFFYIPLAFGRAMSRSLKKIEDAGAAVTQKDDFMVMSDCHSPWYSNIYVTIANDKEVEGENIEKISGSFLAKAFEGDYSNMGNWAREMQSLVKEILEKNNNKNANDKQHMDSINNANGNTNTKMYFYYPTCPKCAKKYGKNHVVIYAKMS
mmetsp:Transcript_25966/g.54847  ORF Transcript_25966/g.54847 Transcript_25966/m.54847 type:complete len:185 (-) Transcript_25966:229-783(-)